MNKDGFTLNYGGTVQRVIPCLWVDRKFDPFWPKVHLSCRAKILMF